MRMRDGTPPLTGTEPTPMRRRHPGSVRRQANFLRRQFLQGGGRPFTDVLTDDILAQALAAVGGWLDRVFSQLVTTGCSSARSRAPTTPAGPPPPASSPTRPPGGRSCVP